MSSEPTSFNEGTSAEYTVVFGGKRTVRGFPQNQEAIIMGTTLPTTQSPEYWIAISDQGSHQVVRKWADGYGLDCGVEISHKFDPEYTIEEARRDFKELCAQYHSKANQKDYWERGQTQDDQESLLVRATRVVSDTVYSATQKLGALGKAIHEFGTGNNEGSDVGQEGPSGGEGGESSGGAIQL